MSHVAKTILQQLGGNRFIAMTGSRNFMSGEDFLSMALAKNKIKASYLKITLTWQDLYLMQFLDRKGDVLYELDGVDFEMLPEVFTDVTGLDTHL